MIQRNHLSTSILTISFCTFIASGLHAQNTKLQYSEISAGPEYAIPAGDFRAGNNTYYTPGVPGGSYKYGIGGSIKYLFHINSMYGLSLQAGGIRYPSGNKGFSFTSFPVKLGGNIRYKAIFVEPQFGLTYFTGNRTAYQNGSTTYGLNLGAYLSDHIVLSGNYEGWNKGGFSASHVGIRLAYALFLESQKIADSTESNKWRPSEAINPQYRETGYWKKHKTFQTLGWVALGLGVPLTFAGLVTVAASIENSRINRNAGYWIMGSGALVTVSSIPFFIVSTEYRKKAKRPIF